MCGIAGIFAYAESAPPVDRDELPRHRARRAQTRLETHDRLRCRPEQHDRFLQEIPIALVRPNFDRRILTVAMRQR